MIILSYISDYSTAHTDDAIYIIGGVTGESRSTVAQYKNDQWQKLSNLQRGRHLHGSIKIADQIVIIGGLGRNEYG